MVNRLGHRIQTNIDCSFNALRFRHHGLSGSATGRAFLGWSLPPLLHPDGATYRAMDFLTAPTTSRSFLFHSLILPLSMSLFPLSCMSSFNNSRYLHLHSNFSGRPTITVSRLLVLLAVPGLADSHRYGQTGGGYWPLRTTLVIVYSYSVHCVQAAWSLLTPYCCQCPPLARFRRKTQPTIHSVPMLKSRSSKCYTLLDNCRVTATKFGMMGLHR